MTDRYTFVASMIDASRCAFVASCGSAWLAIARVQIRLAPAWMRPAMQDDLDRTQAEVEGVVVQAVQHIADALTCAGEGRWA